MLLALQSGTLTPAQVESVFRQVELAGPRTAEHCYLLGTLAYQLKHLSKAVEYLQRSVEQDNSQGPAFANLGTALQDLGRSDEALVCFQRSVELCPELSIAQNNLGIAFERVGRFSDALLCYKRACQLQPRDAATFNNVGNALKGLGQIAEATASYRESIRLQPNYVPAHNNLGSILKEQGSLAEAAACYRHTLKLAPDFAMARVNLANVLWMQHDVPGALNEVLAALRHKPDYASGHNTLGNIYQSQGRLDEAIVSFNTALQLDPDYAEALCNRGNLYWQNQRSAEAMVDLRRAMALKPNLAAVHNNLGNVLHAEGQMAESKASFHEAIRLNPNYADAYSNLGSVLEETGQTPEALVCFSRALAIDPENAEAHTNLGIALLAAGDWERGWQEYEWRWRRPNLPPRDFQQPLWDGSPLLGRTILLHAEQGLGDCLQFIRYASLVKAKGATVVVECPVSLREFVSRCAGFDALFSKGEQLPPFDVHAPLLSLPRLLGVTLANLTTDAPYLFADPDRVHLWHQELASISKLKVGIVWQGNRQNSRDQRRSIAIKPFVELAKVPGVQLISLQKNAGMEQLQNVAPELLRSDFSDRLDRDAAFVDTAAVMKSLDLVISVDTATAHMAGGLGVPVWVPLSYVCDWRWLKQREDTPWYPTMRLFRQTTNGNWAEVFERIARQLAIAVQLQTAAT